MPGAEPRITIRALNGLDEFLRTYPGNNIGLNQLLDELGTKRHAGGAEAPEWFPLNGFASVLELAAKLTRDPCFGLHLTKIYPPGTTGISGFILQSAPDLRTMTSCLARFTRLWIEGLDISYTEEDGIAQITWTYGPELVVPHQQLTELSLALFVDRARRYFVETWRPDKMEFTYREPNCGGEYEALFGRDLVFDAPVNRLTAPAAGFRRPSQATQPLLFKTLYDIAEKELAALAPANDNVARLGKFIVDTIGLGGVDLEQAAFAAGLTPRQLQAELRRQGTTFEGEVSTVRQRLATRYLRDTDLPMTEIALLLGYSELSAFTRAARMWFTLSPTEKRVELRAKSRDRD